MNMNDPFGRLARRRQTEYEAMKTSLQKSGIDTPEKARELVRESRERIYKTAGIAVVVCILLVAAFPQLLPVAVCLAVLVLVLCFKSLVNGKGYIERYIEEELSGEKEEELSDK